MFVYTIQPVVKPIVKPVWQPVVSCKQTFNRLSNPSDKQLYRVYSRLSNRLFNTVERTGVSFNTVVKPVVKPRCTTVLSNRVWQLVERTVAVRSTRLSNPFDNQLYRVYEHATGCQTGLTTGWMFVYTIQPVVKPVVSCKRGKKTQWQKPKCLRLAMEFESEYCRIPTSQIRNPMDFQTQVRQIQIQLSFWKAFFHHLLQSTTSHPKVNNQTLNSYLLMSIQTTQWIGPDLLVQFGF